MRSAAGLSFDCLINRVRTFNQDGQHRISIPLMNPAAHQPISGGNFFRRVAVILRSKVSDDLPKAAKCCIKSWTPSDGAQLCGWLIYLSA